MHDFFFFKLWNSLLKDSLSMKHANISLIHARVELTRFVKKYNQKVGGPLSLHSKKWSKDLLNLIMSS